jgi:hypothetical protein
MEAGMRFSLRSLLMVTAVIAVDCALFAALPTGLSVLALIIITTYLLPVAAIAGIIYGRRYVRAFCIGCVSSGLWVIAQLFFAGGFVEDGFSDMADMDVEDANPLRIICVAVQAQMLLGGLIVAGVRWLNVRKEVQVAAPSTAPIEPQGKAELYTILQGRIAGSAANENAEPHLAAGTIEPA